MITSLMRAPLAATLALVVLATACDDSVVEIGVIEDNEAHARVDIEVPSSVRRDELALVRVTTYGNSCVSIEDTEVDITATGAEITPYNRTTPPTCTADLRLFKHEAQVSFNTLGTKTILVTGRSLDYRSDEVVQKTFTMTVVE
jgi:hypothetical protein